MKRLWLSTAGFVVTTGTAWAQPPPPTGPTPQSPRPPEAPDEDEPEPPRVPPAQDTVGGHLAISPSFVWAAPFGSFEDGSGNVVGSGPGASLEVGYGVSRLLVVGAWGQWSHYGAGDDCTPCKATSLAAGPFLRYHLVQGVRFDPWMSVGAGFRTTSLELPTGIVRYSGLEWLRIAVGGDWYAWDKLGLGPFLELDAGVFSARSGGDLGGQAGHFTLLLGARATFDTPGK